MSRNFYLVFFLFAVAGIGEQVAAEAGGTNVDEVQTLQAIAEEFRVRLEIPEQIVVQVVSRDKRLVSVRRSRDQKDLFLLRFDQNFLTALSPDEMRAAIAHEFGHIWIFTHRPYLQNEALANRKAMQLVPEESLEKVYLKVMQFGGKKQELPKVHTPAPVVGLADDRPSQ